MIPLPAGPAARFAILRRGWGWLIAVATLVAYLPALRGGFVWDDEDWTSNIEPLLRDGGGLWRMWADPRALQQYYPLTGTTFWIQHQVWGDAPLPLHLANVLLHGVSALLLWRLLERLEVRGAWLAGAVFALHPVMVESAGWITERKNVLSMVLFLAALHAAARAMRLSPAGPAVRGRAAWWALHGFFAGAILAKVTACVLPAVIVLLCWWKRGRIRWRSDLAPLLPMMGVAVGFGLWLSWLEKHHVGASGDDWNLRFSERFLVAGRALWFYAGKIFWPAGQCFVYPRWQLDASSPAQWLYPASALATIAALWSLRHRLGRGPLTAVLYFAGCLWPVLGFMNVFGMRFAFVADHWVYLSSPGLIALGSSLVVAVAARWNDRAPAACAAVVLPLLGGLTWRQAGQYRDMETLWLTTLARHPGCWLAYSNLGSLEFGRGRLDEAIAAFSRCLELDPRNVEARLNMGNVYYRQGRLAQAAECYQAILDADPGFAAAHFDLANVVAAQGLVAESLIHYQRALELEPRRAEIRVNFGNALLRQGRADDAASQYRAALEINPRFPEAANNLGQVLLGKGQSDEALAQFRRAVESKPAFAEARDNLGLVLMMTGRADEAVREFDAALDARRDDVSALGNLAWILATCPDAAMRDGPRALELAQRADRITGGVNPEILRVLAAALAESGKFSEAAETARHAMLLASAGGNTALEEAIRQQRSCHSEGKPFRDAQLSLAK